MIVAIHGGLDSGTVPFLHHVLLKRLGERPCAVICDLAGLEAIDVICATVFSTAARPAARWPDTELILAGAPTGVADVLARARVPETIAVYSTVDEAISRRVAASTLARSN